MTTVFRASPLITQRLFPKGILPCFTALLACLLAGCQLPFGPRGSTQEVAQVKNPCIVLALPASGPYASVASRIKQGAETARVALKKNGIEVDLRTVNTESPDWLARLSALPPMCAVVGGPLQDKKYSEARKAGAVNQRVFFAFLPTLAQGDEGKLAWRFFPGQQDQIDAVVNFATDQMDIRTYGSFHPADNYGSRMSEMLEKTLAKRHIPLRKASYPPASPAAWPAAAKALIAPHVAEDGKTMIPGTDFEALFVPDSWRHMGAVTESLRANGETRLALLGTTLWEQGLSGKPVLKPDNYALAVFPVAWNRANPPADLKKGNYNFWTALGYDFINFASHMGLAQRPAPDAVTALAQKTSPLLKAMAPMYWDNNGIAHQKMYLYQPTAAGMAPLNPESFRKARIAAAEKTALQMQGWGHINPDTGEVLAEKPEVATPEPAVPDTASEPSPAPQPAPATTEQKSAAVPQMPVSSPAQGVISSTPRPSYKLSLPVRK